MLPADCVPLEVSKAYGLMMEIEGIKPSLLETRPSNFVEIILCTKQQTGIFDILLLPEWSAVKGRRQGHDGVGHR